MESERKSKGIIIGVLCAVIVFMSIGFAALSSQLKINGNATISDTWNVQIASITKKEGSTGVTETAQPTHTATTANFNVSLKEPGDYAIYTVTVKNTGSLDAVLTQITENEGEGGSAAIKYTVTPGAGSEQGSTLAKTNGIHTFDVKVEYLSTAVGENAPDANASKSLSVTLDYNQKTA
ncbi:MAG: hypothetical protein PUF22_02350 [Clostridium sp.]|nr:hypothetical protein [Clostridium sp.]